MNVIEDYANALCLQVVHQKGGNWLLGEGRSNNCKCTIPCNITYIQQYDAENSNTRDHAYDTVEGMERQLPFERRSSSAATTADQTCSSIPPWSVGRIVGNLDIYFDTYWWGFNILLAYTSFLLLCLQFLLHYSFLFALTTSFISKGALKSSLRVQSLQVNIYDKGPSEQKRILPGFCLDL